MLLNGIRVDISQNLKYDYTYKPPGYDAPSSAGMQRPIDDLLSPGEKVLWRGQPPSGLLVLRHQDLVLMPFFLVWTGFSLFWELMALAMVFAGGEAAGPGICFPLFGLPFVAIGLYMLIGRFIMDVPARRRTYYALTDRRVLIVSGLRDRNVTSLPLGKIDNVEMILHRNGTGTLMFSGPMSTRMARGRYYSSGSGYNSTIPAFDHIQDPKAVYDMALKAQDDLIVRQHGYTPQGHDTGRDR
jgi:hypothetical protein